jgi:hypothetical protein
MRREKMPNKDAKRAVKRATTRSGGPGNFKGTNYQIRFAVLKTLQMIREGIAGAPDARITLEPRLVGDHDKITAWDVRAVPDGECFEAKSAVTGADITSWLALVAFGDNSTDTFTLVYGDGRPMLLRSLDRLTRDAHQAQNAQEFRDLLKTSEVKEHARLSTC